jgi:hypothetical protein
MKKIFTSFCFIVAAILSSRAQTVFITTGTAGTPAYNAGPVYRSAAASAYDASRYTYLYTQAELSAAGISSGSVISLVGWVKNNTATSLGAGGIFRIYMKNSAATSFGLASETWANLNSGATLVYENLTQTIPATATPNYIDFPLTSNFTYTGGALEISTEWDINQVTGNASTGTFDWLWSTEPDRIYGTGNTTLAPITTLSSTTNSISTIDNRRPFIKITYSGGTTGIDVGAVALAAPTVSANNCYTSAETVTIRIRNYSTNPIDFSVNPVTVTTNVTGAVTQTLTATLSTGTLAASATLDIPMTGTLNMNATGVYTFNAAAAITGDVIPANNGMTAVNITKVVLAAGTISASPASYCLTGGTPTLSSTGTTGGNLQWQQSSTSGSGFTNIAGATTTPYTVGSAITQTTYYRLQVSCNGNTVTSNEVTVTLNNPQVTATTPGASCGPGPVTVSLAATGTGTVLNWFSAATGGVPIGTGSPFITPPISSNTTFYVSSGSGGGSTNVGLPAQIAGTSGAGTTNFGLVFNALAPFVLTSVVVYPVAATAGTPGTVTIDVVDAAGVVLNTATVAVIGNPAASATAQTVTLNFNIAAGTNLKLRPGSRTGISGLLFEPSATAPAGNYGYPFTIPGVLSINHSTLTAPPTNTQRLDLYYYFYNWQVVTGCESGRTAVLATVTTPPAATISYAASSYCTNAGTATVTRTGTAGGTYSSTPGLTINAATGDVTLGTSTPGTYTVTYTVAPAGGCPVFTTTASITIIAGSSATIAYTGSPYCLNAGTATVTRTGTAGGTYSSTAGLTINAVTGDVTLSTSTPGTYTVTYTVAANGSCPAFTTTASITITTAFNAAISYAGTPYCSSAGTATVTQTGSAGGTYSSPGGLTLNPTTGAVNIGSSTPGTYTVTYTIPAAGGCAVFTATTSLTITASPSATISYAGSPYCSSAGTATAIRTGTAGGTYSSTAGLTINPATGAVTLGTSTPGTYTVTYTVAAGGGCATFTTTTSITITAANNATIAYAGSPYCNTTGTATVTQTGTAGGVYSATPSGLSLNAATGAITLATSTGGTYTVTYTVAATGGCPVFTTTASVTINGVSTAPTSASASVPNVCLPGGVTNLSVVGGILGTGASYRWYTGSCGGTLVGTGAVLTGISVTATTTFYVRAEGTCGNTACASVTVTANSSPSVVLTFPSVTSGSSQTNPANPSGLFTTVSPPGNYTYVWTLNGSVIPNTGATITPATGLFNAFGTYTVTATNTATGCSATSNAVAVTDIVSDRNKLFITPNPAQSVVDIYYYNGSTAPQVRTVSLFTAAGQRVMNKAYTPSGIYGKMSLDISALAPGTYMVILLDGANNKIASAGMVKL